MDGGGGRNPLATLRGLTRRIQGGAAAPTLPWKRLPLPADRGGFGPFWRKWLIINERNFHKLNAMDRQCPWFPFMMAGVKVKTEPGAVGGPHEGARAGGAWSGWRRKGGFLPEASGSWVRVERIRGNE